MAQSNQPLSIQARLLLYTSVATSHAVKPCLLFTAMPHAPVGSSVLGGLYGTYPPQSSCGSCCGSSCTEFSPGESGLCWLYFGGEEPVVPVVDDTAGLLCNSRPFEPSSSLLRPLCDLPRATGWLSSSGARPSGARCPT